MVVLASTIFVALVILFTYRVHKNYNKTSKVVFTIGSGSKDAMYYPVATALCELFNKHNKDKNVVCEARFSKGAEYNLDAVEAGEFDIGISQANLQYDAYTGSNKFIGKPHKNLRSLFILHYEYLTIIAKKDANINNFSDLRGKKVNIGNPGSGSRILFAQMIEKLRWSLSDFKEIYEESGSNIDKVLCIPDKADAAVYIVGHPNKSFKSMLNNCNTKLISLSEAEIDSFVSLAPEYFHKAFIPEKIYAQNFQKINTFASKTILTTSTKLDPKIVQSFIKIISENKDELIKIQPTLFTVGFFEKSENNIAPLHEGLQNI